MINKFKPKSEFSRNILTLMTGTTIAQAIPIAISPILTRIYTPEDFGIFTLFLSISIIFGSITNGRYELAIMLPEEDEDAINIAVLGFMINILITLFIFFIIIIFHTEILYFLGNKEISPWLYFIPISIFMIGNFNILSYFNNRMKQYANLSKANIYKSLSLAIVQISFSFFKNGVLGLISGQIISLFVSNTKLFFNIKKLNLSKKIDIYRIFFLAKRYRNFPKFSLPTVLSNILSRQIINLAIPAIFNMLTLGYFSLIQRVLAIPLGIIGSSIGKVFFQEAVLEKQLTGNAIRIFNNTFKKLLLISFPIFIFLFFYIKELVELIFGKNWSIAGDYAKIILPLYFINFISSPLDEIINVFEKQKILLIMNLILLSVSIITLSIVKIYSIEFIDFLYFYTYSFLIVYCIFLYFSYKVAKGNNR